MLVDCGETLVSALSKTSKGFAKNLGLAFPGMMTTITMGSLSSGPSATGFPTCTVELLLLSEDLQCKQTSTINAMAMSPIKEARVNKIYSVGVCNSWNLAELDTFTGLMISLPLLLSISLSLRMVLCKTEEANIETEIGRENLKNLKEVNHCNKRLEF